MGSQWLIRLMWNHCRMGGIGWWNRLFLAPESVSERVFCGGPGDGISGVFFGRKKI
jgi:hypothetical protein